MKPKWCCSEARKAEGGLIVFYAPMPTDENITPVRLDAKFFLLCRNNEMKEIQFCPWCGKELEVVMGSDIICRLFARCGGRYINQHNSIKFL